MKKTLPTLCAVVLLAVAAVNASADVVALPGTTPTQVPKDIYDRLYHQLLDLFEKRIAETPEIRAKRWNRDFSSVPKYAASVEPNRAKIAEFIGVGPRDGTPRTATVNDSTIEFPLYDDVRVDALLLLPKGDGPFPVVIACHGDVDSPETICGGAVTPSGRFAQLLVAKGFAVIAPRFLPRDKDHDDATRYRKDLRHIIFRMAYVLGKHPIGVDVETVSAAIDSIPSLGKQLDASRVAIMGAGQGGLTAMYAAALDPRIKAAVIADYVNDRSRVYQEPADRAIFRHLVEFDDSDVCSLIAPRPLEILTPAANPKTAGRELQSIDFTYDHLAGGQYKSRLWLKTLDVQVDARDPRLDAMRDGCEFLAKALQATSAATNPLPAASFGSPSDVKARRDKLYAQLRDHFHAMIESSADFRAKRWANDCKSPGKWPAASKPMHEAYLDLVGRCDDLKRSPLNPRTEKSYDTDDYTGYKVLLDVFPGVETYGELLIPKNIPANERRPVVICQHGFAGTPETVIGPGDLDQYYHRFPHNLARRGYVTFTPYIVVPTEDSEWELDCRSKILGESRVSVCIHQYHAIVDFLQSLPFVDANRIGYQGLSYGGYTGLWVVSQEARVSPVIVAGYFSDWKARLFDDPKGYMPIRSENMYTWNLLHSFNHAELAAMICPRPFFIEHGVQHGPDWVKWSTAEEKPVAALYAKLGIPDRERFYIFPGHHETGTEVAFQFLDKWLKFTPITSPTGVVYDEKASRPDQ